MADEQPSRITVSRDALRADLAEMELRLRLYFDEQLRHKADSGPFLEVALKLDKLDRGDWSQTHRRALVELIAAETAARVDRGWATRERAIAVFSVLTGTVTFILSSLIAIKGGLW